VVERTKGIPSFYGGVYYRSRLEARWAVFFDHLEYDFEFEPTVFKLKKKYTYIPDFHVKYDKRITVQPDLALVKDYWVEVKPTQPTSREEWKVEELSKGLHDTPVYFFIGQPTNPFNKGHGIIAYMNGRPNPEKHGFGECAICTHIDIAVANEEMPPSCTACRNGTMLFETPTLMFAYASAQGHTFPLPPVEDTPELDHVSK